MKVRVLFFSLLRDIAGCEEVEREIAQGLSVGELLDGLCEEFPALREWEGKLLIAVDHEYAGRDAELSAGQEIAIMPPVQGG